GGDGDVIRRSRAVIDVRRAYLRVIGATVADIRSGGRRHGLQRTPIPPVDRPGDRRVARRLADSVIEEVNRDLHALAFDGSVGVARRVVTVQLEVRVRHGGGIGL